MGYCQTSNIRRTLAGKIIADHSDVVGASPVDVVPTISLFLTENLVSMVWAKTRLGTFKAWDLVRLILEAWQYFHLPGQGTGAALVQVMACRLLGAKPLPEPMWLTVNWTPGNKFQRNMNGNYIIFIQENAFENVVCQNGGHFVLGEMS